MTINPWKAFQNSVGRALKGAVTHGYLARYNRLEDGLKMVRTGPEEDDVRTMGMTPQPGDFIATTPTNGLVVIEAKRVCDARLEIDRERESETFFGASSAGGRKVQGRPKKKSTGRGLSRHQLEWIVGTDKDHGVGLLLVEFYVPGSPHGEVYSLRGFAIQHFLDTNERRSIPLDFFKSHGRHLGPIGFWKLHPDDLRAIR